MVTGSALELVFLLVAPPIALIALAFSATLRESAPARRVFAVLALLSLFEFSLFFVSTLGTPGSP